MTSRLRQALNRLRAFFRQEPLDRELDAEIASHLEFAIEENLQRGLPAHEARRQAMVRFGGAEQAKEQHRQARGLPAIDILMQDLRFAIRQLRKHPAFTSTAICVLALGMCASVAIFAFVDAALLKPLPYRNPQRLVGVFEKLELCPTCPLSYPDYVDWKRINKSFSSLDVYQQTGFSLTTKAGAEEVRVGRVKDGFFRTLGVNPALGRDFYSGEDLPGAPRAVLLSYTAWQQRYGGRTD